MNLGKFVFFKTMSRGDGRWDGGGKNMAADPQRSPGFSF